MSKISAKNNKQFAANLLLWFDQFGRKDLPWQQDKTAYRIWISEIMLQQTQVKTVIPYFLKFMDYFPNIHSLATAEQGDVLHLWTGLGYYARARNLHKTAQIIYQQHDGIFPDKLDQLQLLPGIGRSTAAAILSFAYAQHQAILDGNVKRILCRYYRVKGWSGQTKIQQQLWALIEPISPKIRCAEFNQALMDLGSSLCSRSKPQCLQCPLNNACAAYLSQQTADYPYPRPKKKKPQRKAFLLMISNGSNELLLEQRPQQGIWGGLWSFPQCDTPEEIQLWLDQQHFISHKKINMQTEFKHSFSHFDLLITPVHIQIKQHYQIHDNKHFLWFNKQKPLKLGMPTPITKLISEYK